MIIAVNAPKNRNYDNCGATFGGSEASAKPEEPKVEVKVNIPVKPLFPISESEPLSANKVVRPSINVSAAQNRDYSNMGA